MLHARLGLHFSGSRWLDRDAKDNDTIETREPTGPFGDFAKLLYKLNGYRPGPVTGWFVIVSPEPGSFAVGQLWVDAEVPVALFKDHVYDNEADARQAAEALRREQPGLMYGM